MIPSAASDSDFYKSFVNLLNITREQVLADVNRSLDCQANMLHDLLLRGLADQRAEVVKGKAIETSPIQPPHCIQPSTLLKSKSLTKQRHTLKQQMQQKISPMVSLKRQNEFAQSSASKKQNISNQPSTLSKSESTTVVSKTHSNKINTTVQKEFPKPSLTTQQFAKTITRVLPSGQSSQMIYVKRSTMNASHPSLASKPIIVVPKTTVSTQSSSLPATAPEEIMHKTIPSQYAQPSLNPDLQETSSEIVVRPCSKSAPPTTEFTPKFVKSSKKDKTSKLDIDTSCSCADCFNAKSPNGLENIATHEDNESDDEVHFVDERKSNKKLHKEPKRANRRRSVVLGQQNDSNGLFICKTENCKKTFSSKVCLVRHQLTHNVTKSFRCTFPDCKGYIANERKKLLKHIRALHPGISETIKEQTQMDIVDKEGPNLIREGVGQGKKCIVKETLNAVETRVS